MSANKRIAAFLLMSVLVLFLSGSVRAAEVMPDQEITASRYEYETAEAETGTVEVPFAFGRASFLKRERRVIYRGEDCVIVKCLVSRDDTVKEGDVLMQLGYQEDEIVSLERERELQREEEALSLLCRENERTRKQAEKRLQETTEPWDRELQSLQLQKRDLEHEKAVFEAETKIAKLRAECEKKDSLIEILSPIDGTVSRIISPVKEGTAVKDGDLLFRITGETTNILLLEQNEKETPARVHYGTDALFRKTEEGKILQETHALVTASSMIPEMSNSEVESGWSLMALDMPLAPEILEEIRTGNKPSKIWDENTFIERRVTEALKIPRDSVHEGTEEGSFYVRVLSEEGLVNRRNIQILDEAGDYIWVIRGLLPGERVIIRERSL